MTNTNLTPKYWMNIVNQIAQASTCRVNIACILVQNSRIRGVGYLGSISGAKHCTVDGCLFVDAQHMGSDDHKESCIRTVHAETNAVLDFMSSRSIHGGNIISYSTYSPCLTCFKLMAQIGIKIFYYQKEYRDEWRDKLLKDSFDVQHNKYALFTKVQMP